MCLAYTQGLSYASACIHQTFGGNLRSDNFSSYLDVPALQQVIFHLDKNANDLKNAIDLGTAGYVTILLRLRNVSKAW